MLTFDASVTLTEPCSSQEKVRKNSKMNFQLSLLNLAKNGSFSLVTDNLASLGIKFRVSSIEDGIDVATDLMTACEYNVAWIWNISLMIISAYLGGFLYEGMARNITIAPSNAIKISTLMFLMLSVFDFNLLLINSSYYFYLFVSRLSFSDSRLTQSCWK